MSINRDVLDLATTKYKHSILIEATTINKSMY